MNKKQVILSILLFVLIIIIDQIIKVEVKTNMMLGQHIPVTSWFEIAFVENNGMAFGMSFGSKILLTLFRIVTVAFLIGYIFHLTRRQVHTGFIVCMSMITAGAVGNIIDCVAYGEIFTRSTHYHVAELVSWGEGYGDLLEGRVVDMFYFPLIEWNMPGWTWLDSIPFLPNAYEHCIFFSPVFNFADACISCGVIALVLFYRQTLSLCLKNEKLPSDISRSATELQTDEEGTTELDHHSALRNETEKEKISEHPDSIESPDMKERPDDSM